MEPLSQDNQNINISAFRVLYILWLLVRYEGLNVMELNEHLSAHPLISKRFHEETIANYINTLRKSGMPIVRPSSQNGYRYQLKSLPYPLKFQREQLTIVERLLSLAAAQPDEELHLLLYNLFRRILHQANLLDLTEPLRLNEGHLQAHDSVKLHRELMKYYRKLCRDALVLEVTYQDDEGRLIPMEIDPFEVIQQDTRLYLLGVDRRVSQKIKLNLEKIHHVRQLPSKVENRLQPIKVVFALTGRVAKTYRPYPDELILESHDDHIVVQAKTCEHTPLLQRLLKYNIHCEVLAPSYVRQEMRQKIQALRAGLIRSQVSKG